MNIYDLPAADSTAPVAAQLVAEIQPPEGQAAPITQLEPQTPQRNARPQHSWAGSASFWLARICLWYYFLAVAAIVLIAMERNTSNFETLMFVQGLIVLGTLGCFLFNFLGFVFGVVGLCLPSTKKGRTVWGMCLNSLVPATFVLLMVIVVAPRIATSAAQRQQPAAEVDHLAPNSIAFDNQSGDGESLASETFPEERSNLRGLWVPLAAQRDGRAVRQADLAQMSLLIADETITLRSGSLNESGTYRVNPTRTPKTVDFIPPPHENDPPALGIYELDGDHLLLCIRKGGVRPTSLNTPTGAGMFFMKLERRVSW